MLPVAIGATVALAMLVVAPFASAATPNPIASGTTTLTLNGGFNKQLKKAGVRLAAVKPSKLKGTKATFAVTGGELEATTGTGTIVQSGGLKFTWGKKSVALTSLELSTKGKSLSAKIGGKKVKLATLAGVSASRLGFGNSVAAKKLTLTGAGAKSLSAKLAQPTKKGQKAAKSPFKANATIGATTSSVEPETDNVVATGNMTFVGDPTLLGKLAKVGVELQLISPTTASGTTFTSPISGGTISPLGTKGTIDSAGGLKLVQNLNSPNGPSTTITLGSIGVDLAAKTGGVEVIGESNFKEPGTNKEPLKLGNLGRSSIADLTNITTTPSPATRTVTVSATGTIQAIAAEVLNGFVKVHQVYQTEVIAKEEAIKLIGEGKSQSEAEMLGLKIGTEKAAAEAKAFEIKSGEALGSFSFVATGE